MSEIPASPVGTARRPPPETARGVLAWMRANLFSSVFNTVMTLLALWAIFVTIPEFIKWAFVDSVWYTNDPTVCREATGACWAVIAEKYRVMLFGTFPYQEHWRGVLTILVIITMSIISAFKRFWSYKLFFCWLIAFAVVLILMLGGVFGLTPTGTHQWGGLPLTLILFVGTIVGGLPISVFLALGRRSKLPAVKAICIAVIEITRGVPLVTVLFMASMMFPLFMPEGVNF
ncbi:MAG: amino acid ABC transporter permease, partial [Desulfobacterales bacterium]